MKLWKAAFPESEASIVPNMQSALQLVRAIGTHEGPIQCLITGSLYLVGDALYQLKGGAGLQKPNT